MTCLATVRFSTPPNESADYCKAIKDYVKTKTSLCGPQRRTPLVQNSEDSRTVCAQSKCRLVDEVVTFFAAVLVRGSLENFQGNASVLFDAPSVGAGASVPMSVATDANGLASAPAKVVIFKRVKDQALELQKSRTFWCHRSADLGIVLP